MNSDVRRRLGATFLRSWTSHTTVSPRLYANFSSGGSFCDGILSQIESHQRFDHKRLFQGVTSQYSHSLTIHQTSQRATPGVTAWEWRWISTRCFLLSNKSIGFEQKIWDRRKHLSYLNLESRRHLCGSIKLLESHSKQEAKSKIGKIEVTANTSHDVLEPSNQRPKGVPASAKTASDARQKHLIDRLPNLPHIHRPSKEELLAAATGFWSRLKVRFKWFSIRSARPFNVDEIGAFFSWVLLGHVIWIVLGTTTFFSLAIFAVNTVFAQGEFITC